MSTIITSILGYFFNKKFSKYNKTLDNSTYVSKIVFNKIFEVFQQVSKSMFDTYNIAIGQMFPLIEKYHPDKNREETINYMIKILKDAETNFNNFINLIYINKFIIPENIFVKLNNFEKNAKQLICSYEFKIQDNSKDYISKFITPDKNNELITLASHTQTLYNELQIDFYNFLNNLIIIE